MSILATIKGFGLAAKAFTILHAPAILAVGAVVGVAVTAYDAYKAGKRAQVIIQEETKKKGEELTFKEKAKVTRKLWIKVVIEVALIASGIIFSYKIQARRLAQLTQSVNLLLATNRDLNKKLDAVIKEYPDAQKIVDEIDVKRASKLYSAAAADGIPMAEVPGTDLFHDPNTGLWWYGDYNHTVSATFDAKENFNHCGYLPYIELYKRWGVPVKDIPGLVYYHAWDEGQSQPDGMKWPLIRFELSPLFDKDGLPIKGRTFYMVKCNPPDRSEEATFYEDNRVYGMDYPAYEEAHPSMEDMYDETPEEFAMRVMGSRTARFA